MKALHILAASAALLAVFACNKDNRGKTPDNNVSVTVSPSSVTLPGEGGSAKLAVETTAEPVTCEVSDAWLTAQVNGKEITLTAAANPDTEASRQATLTVKAGSGSATVAVTQTKGSAFPGYTELTVADGYYSGIMMLKMVGATDYDGGWMTLSLGSEDGRYSLILECYTECFETADAVTLTTGTYAKGEDNPALLKYVGKKLTWVPGALYTIEDEDGTEELQYGSCLYTTIGEEESVQQITDGSFTVEEADGIYTIKADLKAEDGSDVKFYHIGKINITTDGAVYPGESRANPEAFDSVSCTLMGEDEDCSNLQITLMCEGGMPATTFSIYTDILAFDDLANTDLSGTYSSDKTGAGSCDLGTALEMGDFTFPMGSYIMFALMDYFIPDSMVVLTLKKSGNGYIVTGTMENSDGETYSFMDDKTVWEFEYADGTAEEEED